MAGPKTTPGDGADYAASAGLFSNHFEKRCARVLQIHRLSMSQRQEEPRPNYARTVRDFLE
jgi:hypothetical protein